MTMTGHERERMMRLSEDTARLATEMVHVKESIERIDERLDEMYDYLKGITDDVSSIRVQNAGHEGKLAMLQALTASLGETGAQIERSCKRLKYMLFGFAVVLAWLAVMVGALGEDIIPGVLKWLWALVGL